MTATCTAWTGPRPKNSTSHCSATSPTCEELHTVIMQMIGELNASHTGISGGGNPGQAPERVQTRYPGFDLEPDASGFYKVSYIYQKRPRRP